MRWLIAVSLAGAMGVGIGMGMALAAERQTEIPPRFQGEWNAQPEHCGTDRNASRLRIGAERIHFYESAGQVEAAVTRGDSDLALIVSLTGEGDTWLNTRHFRLSDDQQTLTDVTGGEPFVRYRCP